LVVVLLTAAVNQLLEHLAVVVVLTLLLGQRQAMHLTALLRETTAVQVQAMQRLVQVAVVAKFLQVAQTQVQRAAQVATVLIQLRGLVGQQHILVAVLVVAVLRLAVLLVMVA
jgi:hypothetical protein